MPITTPTSVDQVTAEWLTQVLRDDGTIDVDGAVAAVHAEQIAIGTGFLSDLFRLRLDGAGPASLIIKFPAANDVFRSMGDRRDVYHREIEFYRTIAPRSPLPTPRAHHAEVTADGVGVLLLEDLGSMHSPDHIDGLPREQTEVVLRALAEHHAWGALHVDPHSEGSPVTALADQWSGPDGPTTASLAAGWDIYLANRRHDHDPSVDRLVARVGGMIADLGQRLSEPACLLHGDLRVDNLFFDADRLVVVDHQFPLRGSGLYDVAYLVSQGMPSSVRRGADRELVELYAAALAAHGVALDVDTAWSQYLDAVVLLLVFPLGAIAGWPVLGERARELILTLIERWIATVDDLDLHDHR